MKKQWIWSGIAFFIVRFGLALILLMAGFDKITGGQMSVETFSALGMEPYGRHIIGWCELICVLLLSTNRWAHFGAGLTFSIMLGALIAHVTVLGFNIQQDQGKALAMFLVVFFGSLWIQWMRRQDLPFVGESFQ